MSPRDFAVFYRTNAQSRVLEDAFRARNLPYVVVGGTRFFDRAEIKDLICYLRAIANPDDGMALQRIINVPARGIGAATVDKISEVVYNGRRASAEAPPPARGAQAELPLAQRGARKMTAWSAVELCANDESILGSGPRKKVAAFVTLMNKLRAEGAGLGPADAGGEGARGERLPRRAGRRVDASRPRAASRTCSSSSAQMREYEREAEEPTLAGFLERIALASDVDGYDPEKGAVSLMTVHTAKGLEFPVVFITGLEERIFPHARSVDDDSAVEEERRLCYVAVTRARTQLLPVARAPAPPVGAGAARHPQPLPARAAARRSSTRSSWSGRASTAAATATARGRGPGAGSWNRDDVPEYQRDAAPPASRRLGRARRRRRRPGRAPRPASSVVHYDADASSDDERPAHRRQAAPPAVRRRRGARLAVVGRRHEGHHAFSHARA